MTKTCDRLVRSTASIFLIALVTILAAALQSHGQPGSGDGPAALGFEVFKARRQVLMDSLGEGTAILYSQGEESEAGYRADGNFWYLTGIDERGAILVLSPGERNRDVLLLPSRDPETERWTGLRPDLTEALQDSLGFDLIRRTGSLNGLLVVRMKHSPVLHLISSLVSPSEDMPPDLELYSKVLDRIPDVEIENSSRLLEAMRMIKSEDEIAAIEAAVAVTYQGINDLLGAVEPGVYEYQLDGILEASFKRQGAQFSAFPPIVGAGLQTTILHYEKRDQQLKAGQLLLLDVAAEWDRYASDISRTVPVDGKFTPEQVEIYDLVLAAQKAAIEMVKPGVTINEINEEARRIIRDAGYVDAALHGTSHFLGLDVHDVGDKALPLKAGMVITVEPGLYLPDREVGVRIEDDILVTKDGHRVLSAAIPKEREAVEQWITSARQ